MVRLNYDTKRNPMMMKNENYDEKQKQEPCQYFNHLPEVRVVDRYK